LFEAARSRPAASTGDAASAGDARFRLAIDRVFSLAGAGTVATGTVHAGRVQVGDELRLVPGDRSLRVRSLHVQNRSATSAPPGTRCAIALAGVEKQQVERGQWLVAPEAALQTLRFDAELRLSPGQSEPLRSGQSVHVHLGSAATTATVAVLDRAVLAPGECGIVQVVLRSPWAAWRGDRVVLRDASATRTIAGGRVLDPLAPARYRRTPQRLAELAALSRPDPADRLAGLIGCAPQGVDLRRHAAAEGRALPPMPPSALQQHEARGDWAVGAAQVDAARQQVLEVLAAFHQREPDALGPDAARLRRLALPRWPEPLWRALLADLQADGHVVQRGACVHRPEHAVRLSASEERIAQKVAPMLAVAGFEGAWARDLARDSAEPEPLMRVTLSRLAQRGELHQVVKDLFYPLATMARLAALARDVAGAHEGSVTAAAYRDATGLGRKRAIQILEHFDRIGLLRRVGDLHRLRVDSDLFRGDDGDPPPEPSRAPRPAAGARQAA
jgi:selenocysteine-specific elongation factor